MVREREDSGLWISLCNGENLQDKKKQTRLKSIMPHGDICKGKISFQGCLHVVFLNRYHHVDFILVFICFLHALYRLNSLEALICQLCINYILHHMYAYIQGELSLCNVRVKFCDLFHSTYKGSQSLTLPCATNVFLFDV